MPGALDIPAFRDARSSYPWLVRGMNAVGKILPASWLGMKPISADAIWDAARKGDLAEREPTPEAAKALDVLVESLVKNVDLTPLGQFSALDDSVRMARTHLRIHAALEATPEIRGTELPPPIFILGWPRTGSTFLHQLLGADPAARTIPYWESFDPVPPQEGKPDRRAEKLEKMLGQLRFIAPGYDAIHPMAPNMTEECVALFMNEFRTLQFDFQYRIPEYANWLLGEDANVAYEAHLRQLELIQFHRPHGAYQILKDPTHLIHFETIVARYPDAKFILTHRDPAESLSSMCSLVAYTRSLFTEEVDPQLIGAELLSGYWPKALERSRRIREQIPQGQVVDVLHADLRRDPLGTAASIYETLQVPFVEQTSAEMHRHLGEVEATPSGKHSHSLEGFGLTRGQVRERLEDYCEEVGV